MKKHHVILLLLAFLLLQTGCGAGSAAEHAASTPAADARILTALAPGIVVRRAELPDGLLVFGDLVTAFGCRRPDPPGAKATRRTITYAGTTALLGIDYFAAFSVSGLRGRDSSCGSPHAGRIRSGWRWRDGRVWGVDPSVNQEGRQHGTAPFRGSRLMVIDMLVRRFKSWNKPNISRPPPLKGEGAESVALATAKRWSGSLSVIPRLRQEFLLGARGWFFLRFLFQRFSCSIPVTV